MITHAVKYSRKGTYVMLMYPGYVLVSYIIVPFLTYLGGMDSSQKIKKKTAGFSNTECMYGHRYYYI